MSVSSDRSLLAERIARVAAGDARALGDVYRLTAAKLFGVCLRILGNESDAEEVLQEVYVTVWRRAGRFEAGRASPVTWLATIARNRAIDRLRSGRVARSSGPLDEAAEIAHEGASPADQVETADSYARLAHCLEELEQSHAEAIRSAFLDGLTYEALAEKGGVPLGTMKSRIRRSLLKLRTCLEP